MTGPIIDFAEIFNTGTNPRTYLKKLIGEKLGLYSNYIIINDNNIFFLLDETTKDQIKSFDNIFLDLSQNPFLQEKVDHYKSLLVRPSQHLYVIVGDANFLHKKINEPNITYYYSEFFHTWYSNDTNRYTNIPEVKFSSLNSIPRIHRIILANELFRQGLMNEVLLSFLYNMQDHHKDWVSNNHYFQQDVSKYKTEYDFFLEHIAKQCPILLKDDPEYHKHVNDYSISSPAYNNTALNIITESTNDQHFFTEKTWKPIFAKQLFLLVGCKDSIARLREFGFDTFDDYIDHSYDLESDLVIRIKTLVKELKRLSPEIFKIYTETKLRRESNLNYLKSNDFEQKINLIECRS